MRTFVVFALTAASCLFLNAASQDKPTIKIVPPTATSAASGSEMFATYCAVCHGKSGKGGGPAAAALKTAPSDLTQISRRNEGKFPEIKVHETIAQSSHVTAHGDSEMPVWGPVFKSIESGDSLWRLRVQNLTEYIKSIQVK